MEIAIDTNVRAARQLAAGRVTLTFTSPTGTHITITAKCRAPKESGNGWETSSLDRAKVIFIEVPSEGYNDKVGKVTQAKGFVADPNADAARVYCAKALLAYVAGQPTAPSLQIQEEDICGKCGRALTDPVSIARGIGPECFGASTGSQHQVKGDAVVVDGRIVQPDTAPDADGNVDVYLPETNEQQVEQAFAQAPRRSRPQRTLGWREEKDYVAQARADVTPAKPSRKDRPCSQLSVLPGDAWEDIFR